MSNVDLNTVNKNRNRRLWQRQNVIKEMSGMVREASQADKYYFVVKFLTYI